MKKKNISKIISYTLGIIIILTFIIFMLLELILPKENVFVIWAKENIWDITMLPSILQTHYKVFIQCIILITVVFALSKIIRFILKNTMKKSNKKILTVIILKPFSFSPFLIVQLYRRTRSILAITII